MTIIEKVLELLTLRIGERFEFDGEEGVLFISSAGVVMRDGENGIEFTKLHLEDILAHPDWIIHIPFSPKKGEGYYTVSLDSFIVCYTKWMDKPVDFLRKESGLVFRYARECNKAIQNFEKMCKKEKNYE